MRFKFSKKYLFIFLVLILGLVFLNVFPGVSRSLKGVIFKIFSPIQRLFIGTGNDIIGFFEIIISIKNLGSENAELNKKNIEMEAELSRLKETERENKILRETLNFSQKNTPLYEIASVVGKEIQGGGDWILINKGSKNGVEKDNVIISEGFSLVGRVFEVNKDFSKILLITNPNSVVAAIIENKRSEGLIQKEEGGNKIFMDFIPKDENPGIGEKVITSGMDKIYPKGILIGKIENVDLSQNQLFKKVIIAPATDFNKLEEVFIIKFK
jgi:rod shape-determining protein MreC